MGTDFVMDTPAYVVGSAVRIYDHSGEPLPVVGRVRRAKQHGNGDVTPVYLYDVITADPRDHVAGQLIDDDVVPQVYTGLPANRLGTYGGCL